MDNISSDFEQNLKIIYKHFYNYLPQFMGNSFQGIGLIFDVGTENLQLTKEAGIELGYFFQFGILSYIMTAVISKSSKESVKAQLAQISSIL